MRMTGVKGVCMALAVFMAIAGTPLFSVGAQAYDSGHPPVTARETAAAVNAMHATDAQEVDWIVAAMRALPSREKALLASTTIRKLDAAYAFCHGYSQSLTVRDGTATANRISKTSASISGGTAAAGGSVSVTLWQDKPSSSSVYLQFTTESSHSLDAPVVYSFSRPSNISTAYDYYIKDESGNRMTASVSSSTVSFVAVEPESTFRVYRGSKTSSDDDEADDPEVMTAFWEDVVSDIKRAERGERVRVTVGSRTTMPADVLRALRGRSVSLALRRSSGETIVIDGKDLPIIPVSRDYYTMTTLKRLYGSSPSLSSSSRASSSSAVSRPADPPAPSPLPVISPVTPAPQPSTSTRAAVSSKPSLPEEPTEPSSSASPAPILERSAQEDAVSSAPPASSLPEETPVAAPDPQSRSYVLFVVLCIVFSATGASLLTLLISGRHKIR